MTKSAIGTAKPIGGRAYGSIGHLPDSRLGPADRSVHKGQARICTEQTRDRHDTVIVQEKLDGSCVAVANVGGRIVALGRAGWPAASSPYAQHTLFDRWVRENESRFRDLLRPSERIIGEWLAQAHGTLYDLRKYSEPFFAFDIIRGSQRLPYAEFCALVKRSFQMPHLLHIGEAIPIGEALNRHQEIKVPCDMIEGVVYRVERYDAVDFLAKYVRHDKVDGKFLDTEVWNWPPTDHNGQTK